MTAAGRPEMFALDTAIGPTSRSSSMATGCSGIRSITVPGRVTEIPLQRRRLLDDQAQCAGPERANQLARGIRHGVHQAVDGVPGPDEHGNRHVAAAALGRQQRGDRGAVERVGADPVDGVGGQDDEPATLDAR